MLKPIIKSIKFLNVFIHEFIYGMCRNFYIKKYFLNLSKVKNLQ